MMSPKITAMFFIIMIFMLNMLPPIQACTPSCSQPHPPSHHPKNPRPKPPTTKHPPQHGSGHPKNPPVVVLPPIVTPPSTPYPPYTGNPPSEGGGGGGVGGVPGFNPPPSTQPTCPINALKLGLCVDVLGGLVHIGLGDPVENVCCPVLKGLLELEAAICLCTTIRLKLLNLNIFIPLALQVLITCGITPPPGFVCPPL